MRYLQYLNEKYITNVQGTWSKRYSGVSDVFTNPTAKELRDLDPELRFIINFKTKNLYVWNWNITHIEMGEYLYKHKMLPSSEIAASSFLKTCYAGLADKKTGIKLEYDRSSDNIDHWNFKKCAWANDGTDDSWLEPWFGGGFIKRVKEEIGEVESHET